MSIKSLLHSRGITKDSEQLETVFQNIYPTYLRIWWWIGLHLGRGPFTAERQFIRDFLDAHQMHQVEEAFGDYRSSRETKTLFMKPSRRRVKAYFEQVVERGMPAIN